MGVVGVAVGVGVEVGVEVGVAVEAGLEMVSLVLPVWRRGFPCAVLERRLNALLAHHR